MMNSTSWDKKIPQKIPQKLRELNILPLEPNSKKPSVSWKKYQRRKYDKDFPKKCNFGVVCGEISNNLVVVDFDHRELYNRFFYDIETFTVETPSGGVHLFFYGTEPVNKIQRFRNFPIDILGEKALAVIPPSEIDGKSYKVLKDAEIQTVDVLKVLNKGLPNLERKGLKKDLKDKVKDIKQQVTFSDYIARYITKKYQGKGYWMGLCPFHQDTNPSFTVYEDSYYCFGCEAHGDVINFVQDIEGVNFGEAVNRLCLEYDIPLPGKNTQGIQGTPGNQTDKIKVDDLLFPTNHLPYFKEFRSFVGLQGDEYIPILKAHYYAIISSINSRAYAIAGNIVEDFRVHVITPLPSGKGKGELIKSAKAIMKELGKKVGKPTSLHPEQLIGKVKVKEKKKEPIYTPIEGHLALDFLVLDEVRTLMKENEINYQESRKYLREAKDRYGDNKVEKKQVDVPHEERLRYEPDCPIVTYIQPVAIPEERVEEGDLRRDIIPFVRMGGIDRKEHYKSRVFGGGKENKKNSLEEFISFLERKRSIREIEFTEEAQNKMIELHLALIETGNTSEIIRNYLVIKDYTYQNYLVKLAALQAWLHGRDEVGVEDVERAFIDLFEFAVLEFDYIENKILGFLDYGEGWAGARGEEQKCLRYLYDEGAVSMEKSNISIDDYIKIIQQICSLSYSGAQKRYYKFKNLDWIDSRQIYQGDTRVWINFTPQSTQMVQGKGTSNVLDIYHSLVNKYTSQGDGYLGDLGYLDLSDLKKLDYVTVKVTEMPSSKEFVGIDGVNYKIDRPGQVLEIPEANAKPLLKKGHAIKVSGGEGD